MKYLFAFISVYVIMLFLIPVFQKNSVRIGFMDQPTERKKHKEPIPLLGGVAIFIGFVLGAMIFVRPMNMHFIYKLTAALMILAIGLVDDWYKTRGKEFSVLPRLAVQIAAAVIAYKAGAVFAGFTNPFNQQYVILPEVLQFILSVLWILGVTTVINWSTVWMGRQLVCHFGIDAFCGGPGLGSRRLGDSGNSCYSGRIGLPEV